MSWGRPKGTKQSDETKKKIQNKLVQYWKSDSSKKHKKKLSDAVKKSYLEKMKE